MTGSDHLTHGRITWVVLFKHSQQTSYINYSPFVSSHQATHHELCISGILMGWRCIVPQFLSPIGVMPGEWKLERENEFFLTPINTQRLNGETAIINTS